MKLKPFAVIIALSKEKLAESLAPIRARKMKSQAELEMAKLDDELVRLEADIQEQCSKEDINFPNLLDKLDKVALLERRKTQYESVLAQLFPAKT
jgi:23S rRNA pseudoU1915 N3-methylase RlmH